MKQKIKDEILNEIFDDWRNNPELQIEESFEKIFDVTKQKTLKEFAEILVNSYKKCSEELINIKKQKPRENNTPRDWEQRLDEILLIYSNVFGLSYNESKNKIKKEMERK